MGEHIDSPSDENLYISPRYRKDDWQQLDLTKPESHDWEMAVNIFLDRINGRFLIPINRIINYRDWEVSEFSGFIVIGIDCLLIETLNQFYRGENETTGYHDNAFWEFFNRSKFFQKEINSKRKATIFYQHFRCGILHQAQTKKLSRIRIGMPTMVQESKKGNLSAGFIIDRNKFHQALIDEINDYAEKLRTPTTPNDYDLRSKFLRKMSFIVS
jgi:hypothetical protein